MAKSKPAPQTFIQRSRDVGAAQKAFYHNISGAGGKVTRKFLGLTKDEQHAVKAKLIDGLEQELRKQARRG